MDLLYYQIPGTYHTKAVIGRRVGLNIACGRETFKNLSSVSTYTLTLHPSSTRRLLPVHRLFIARQSLGFTIFFDAAQLSISVVRNRRVYMANFGAFCWWNRSEIFALFPRKQNDQHMHKYNYNVTGTSWSLQVAFVKAA